MNHIQFFIPNYPPPPIPLSVTTLHKSNSMQVPVSLYKERLNSYLESRRKNQSKKVAQKNVVKTMKLGEVSKKLSRCVHLINTMNEKIKTLSQLATSIDIKQWNDHISELNSKTNDLSAICSNLVYFDGVQNIKQLINKRLERRYRISKRKSETKLLKKYETNRREKKHQQINQCLEEKAREIQQNRRQIENKQRVEQILMDVKSRQSEAEKFIALFDLVRELHCIRNRDKYSSGGHSDAEFNREINEMKEIWINASKKYEDEEKELRKFINCTDKNYEEWRDVLFGAPAREYRLFTRRKKDDRINQLIEIRSQWDKCIVPHSNSFGTNRIGWAYPKSSPSAKWETYLKSI